jgi:hypothetical protein
MAMMMMMIPTVMNIIIQALPPLKKGLAKNQRLEKRGLSSMMMMMMMICLLRERRVLHRNLKNIMMMRAVRASVKLGAIKFPPPPGPCLLLPMWLLPLSPPLWLLPLVLVRSRSWTGVVRSAAVVAKVVASPVEALRAAAVAVAPVAVSRVEALRAVGAVSPVEAVAAGAAVVEAAGAAVVEAAAVVVEAAAAHQCKIYLPRFLPYLDHRGT